MDFNQKVFDRNLMAGTSRDLMHVSQEDEDMPETGRDTAGDLDAQQSGEESDVDQCTARLMRYCARVKDTVLWGGEMELRALSCALKRTIKVFSSEMDALEIGPEFAGKAKPSIYSL